MSCRLELERYLDGVIGVVLDGVVPDGVVSDGVVSDGVCLFSIVVICSIVELYCEVGVVLQIQGVILI